jgi:NAD(P)-dependent dehydrogenase (short-subunit alcohol dehydrogenase family)
MRFSEKVLLVTGGTQGIGLEVAIAAATEGALVTVCGRSIARGDRAVEEAARRNVRIDFVECSVQDEESVARMVEGVVAKYGKLDIAFNNAGITSEHAKLGGSSVENWRQVIGINLTGAYLCMKHEIESMLQSGGGNIVNTSSAAGVMAIGGQAAYVASKSGIIGLSQSAAIDYANAATGPHIRINVIAPGPILGGMNDDRNLSENSTRTERKIGATAMRRFGTALEVADVALWLLSAQSSYVTGSVISVDGGYASGKF